MTLLTCNKKYSSILLATLLFLTSGCVYHTDREAKTMLPNNFYIVSDELFRSKQPSQREMQKLHQFGIKTVINLRLWHSDRDEVEGTDIDSIWIRMRAGKITDDKMIEILKAIYLAPKPVLVHCWHGSDRTGVVIAMYRLVFQNWSKADAINELMQPEFGHHYNVYPNIIKYLQTVNIEKMRSKIFTL